MGYEFRDSVIRRLLLILGIVIVVLSVLLMIISSFMHGTVLAIVLSDISFVFLLYGIPVLIIWLVTKPVSFQTKQNKFFKGVFIVVALVTLVVFTIPRSITSIVDLSAVVNDDFHFVEGEITSTFISSSRSSSTSSTSSRSGKYMQIVIIDGNSSEAFKYFVGGIEDYHLLKGENYRLKAFPGSKLILEYEHLSN